ncbi:hypothetical protein XANCAGTX0491_009539 [Xanthoria calcicola]
MSPSAAIVDYLLNTAEPLPEKTRPASALPWNPPTWQRGMPEAQTSELNTKHTQSKTVAQAAFPPSCPADNSVSSEMEEVSGGSAGGNTPTESSSRGGTYSPGVRADLLLYIIHQPKKVLTGWQIDLETPKPQHEMSHPQMSTTTEAHDIQGHDNPGLKTTENVTPMSTADHKQVPYQGPTIIDGSIEEHYVPPQTINTPDCVHQGRTVTRQTGLEVYLGPLPMGQADQDVQYGQTPTRQAGSDAYYGPTPTRQAALYLNPGPIPMTQAGQNVQYDQTPARPAFYSEPRYPTTRFNGMIFGTSMISGECRFRASIISKPAEQEAIFQDLYRNNQHLDVAAIIDMGPFWVSNLHLLIFCFVASLDRLEFPIFSGVERSKTKQSNRLTFKNTSIMVQIWRLIDTIAGNPSVPLLLLRRGATPPHQYRRTQSLRSGHLHPSRHDEHHQAAAYPAAPELLQVPFTVRAHFSVYSWSKTGLGGVERVTG